MNKNERSIIKYELKRLQLLLAVLPTLLCFGPFFETQFRFPWLSVGGALALLCFLAEVRRILSDVISRVEKLESMTKGTDTTENS